MFVGKEISKNKFVHLIDVFIHLVENLELKIHKYQTKNIINPFSSLTKCHHFILKCLCSNQWFL